jgi:hypothetical protein
MQAVGFIQEVLIALFRYVHLFLSFAVMKLMIRQIHSQVALLLILHYGIVELNKACVGLVCFFLYTPMYYLPSVITHENDFQMVWSSY